MEAGAESLQALLPAALALQRPARRWLHKRDMKIEATTPAQQGEPAGRLPLGFPRQPVVGLAVAHAGTWIRAPLPSVPQLHPLGLDPRLTLDLMFLSCRATQDLSFFKKSGLLLDFIISEETNRPITFVF